MSEEISEMEMEMEEKRYPWKYTKDGCWNDLCKEYKNGICQNPSIPVEIGCPATYTFYVRKLYKGI